MADELEPIGATVDAPAELGPPPVPAAPELDPVGASVDAPWFGESRRQSRIAAMDAIFQASRFKDGDRHARVLEAGTKLGLTDFRVVDQNLEGFTKAVEDANWDPARFVDENPILADLLFKEPEAAPIAMRTPYVNPVQALKYKLRDLHQLFGAASAWLDKAIGADPALKARLEAHRRSAEAEGGMDLPPEMATLAGVQPAVPSPSGFPTPEEAATEQAQRQAFLSTPQPMLVDPAAHLEGWERFFGAYSWTPEGGVSLEMAPPWARYLKRSWKEQVARAGLGGELRSLERRRMWLEDTGQTPDPDLDAKIFEAKKRAAELQNQLAPTDFGARGVETLFGEALNLLPSQGVAVAAGASGAAAGSILLGSATLLGTRDPARAALMAQRGWRWGGAVGALYATRELEGGNAYLDMVEEGIDPRTASVASEAYSWMAAAVEVGALDKSLRMFGRLGDAAVTGKPAAFAREMVRDTTVRTMVADAAKRWAVGTYAEAQEEAIQELLQDLATYAGKSATAGEMKDFTRADIEKSLEGAAEVFIRTGIGTALLGVGGVAVNVGSQLNHVAELMKRDESIAAVSKTQAILSFLRDSSLAKAKPELVSELIRQETEASGRPVTSVFVDALQFIRLFQEDGKNGAWEVAAQDLGGEQLVDKLKAAAATGQKVEVPLEEFTANWAGKPIAEALSSDMTVRRYGETAREIIEKQATIREEARKLADEYLVNNPPPKSDAERAAIEAVLGHELAAAGRDAEEVRQGMALWRAYIHTVAKAWKKPASEIFEQFRVMVEKRKSSEAKPEATTQQGDVTLSEAARAAADRAVDALASQVVHPGPAEDAEVVVPPDRLFQLERDVQFDDDGNIVSAELKGTGFDEYREKVSKWMKKQGYTDAQIKKRMAETMAQLMIMKSIVGDSLKLIPATFGERLKKGPLRANVDPIYKLSFDASAMCVKRLEASATQAYIEDKLRELRPNRPSLTASERIALVALFKMAGKTAPCLYCYVESPRGKASEQATNAVSVITGEQPIRKNWKVDAREAAQLAVKEFKKSGLAASDINVAYVINPLVARTKEAERAKVKHKDIYDFIEQQVNYAKSNKPKLYHEYTGELLDLSDAFIKQMNDYAGFRFFSTSDFQAEHVIDLIQAFRDLSFRKARAHSYTKVVDFVRIFGKTGMKIQTSVFAAVPAVVEKRGEDWVVRDRITDEIVFRQKAERAETGDPKSGKRKPTNAELAARAHLNNYTPKDGFVEDAWQGMGWEDARKFSSLYKNVGAVFVATSDAQVKWALEQDWVHYIIPFHYSGLESKYYEQMGWADFTSVQSEKRVKGITRAVEGGGYEVVFYGKVEKTFTSKAEANKWRAARAREYWAAALERMKQSGDVPAIEVVQDEETSQFNIAVDGEVLVDKEGNARTWESREAAEEAATKVPKVKKIRMHELTNGGKAVNDGEMRDRYMALAKQRGVEPVFAQFAEHENYAKLKKDYARTDQNFDAVDANQIDIDAAGEALRTVMAGEAVKAVVDRKIAKQLLSIIESGNPEAGRIVLEALEQGRTAKQALEAIRAGAPGAEPAAVPGLLTQEEARVFQEGSPSVIRGWLDKSAAGVHRLYKIAVTEHANRSTFVHESAHVFLDMMGELAEDPKAPERLRADYATALKWMGAIDRNGITREMEEKWARSFEAYLMTGKAPSLSLVRAFTRFRLWLGQIYKAITNIPGAQLDDTITGVFDRMLATDQEIENVKQQMGLQQLWRSPEEAGMTPDEWRDYLEVLGDSDLQAAERARVAVMREQLREVEAWWKDEEANVKQQLEQEYDRQPGWLAYRMLKLNDAGGNPALEALTELDLNEAAVEAALKESGSYYVGALKKKLAGAIDKKGVLTPDELGAVFGMSGSEILRAIADIPARDRWVKTETSRAMAEQHGDVMHEREKLTKLVADALHEGPQIHYLMHEYDVLRQRAGQAAGEGAGGVPASSMRLAAEDIVRRTQAGELSEKRALHQERRASEEAFRLVAKGDLAGALVAKQRQILNMLIYRASQEARERLDSFERLVAKQADDKRRMVLGKADRAYLDVTDRILEAIGVRAVPTDPLALQGRKDLDDLDARLMLDGLETGFDRDVVQAILDNPPQAPASSSGEPRPAYLALTVDQIRELDAALRQMRKAANDIVRVNLGDQKIAIEALNRTIAIEAGGENVDRGKQPGPAKQKTWWFRTRLAAEDLNAELTNPQLLIERLGPTAYKFLWDGYNATQLEEARLYRAVFEKVQDSWKALSKADQKALSRVIDDADLPYPPDVDRSNADRNVMWLIMVALNSGNQSNLDRLLGGYEWTLDQVVKALEKYLTHDQMAWVQSIWDLMDKELYPEMAAVHRRVNGILPNKIPARPLTLAIGGVTKTYAGGYFPARYDPVASRSRLGAAQVDGPMAKMLGGQGMATTMNRSFTKARVENFSDVISLDWNVLPSHIFDLIHYVATDEFVREAYRVMQQPVFQTTVRHALGEASNRELDQWLKVVAAGARVAQAAQDLRGITAAMGFFRSRFTMGVLGGSIQTMLGDLPAPLVAVADSEVAARYMAPAVLEATTVVGWVKMREHALSKSALLRNNKDNWRHKMAQELALPMKEVTSNRAKEALEFARDAAWYGFAAIESMTSTIIWEARYRQGLAAGFSEEHAAAEADQVIEHLYPSHDLAKQAGVLRSSRMAPMLAFYSYFSSRYNQGRRAWHPAAKAWAETEGFSGAGGAMKATALAAGQTVAAILVTNVLSELLSGRGPEEDEEVPEWMLRKSLEGAFVMVPFGGTVAESLIAALELGGKKRAINERASPFMSVAFSVGKAMQKAASGDAEAFDVALAAGEVAAYGLKLPVMQPKRTIKYLFQGEDRSARGVASGLIYGERQNQPANVLNIGGR